MRRSSLSHTLVWTTRASVFALTTVAAANDRLDQLLTERERPVVRVESRVAPREVAPEAELDALLAELRALIAPHVAAGRRVRLT